MIAGSKNQSWRWKLMYSRTLARRVVRQLPWRRAEGSGKHGYRYPSSFVLRSLIRCKWRGTKFVKRRLLQRVLNVMREGFWFPPPLSRNEESDKVTDRRHFSSFYITANVGLVPLLSYHEILILSHPCSVCMRTRQGDAWQSDKWQRRKEEGKKKNTTGEKTFLEKKTKKKTQNLNLFKLSLQMFYGHSNVFTLARHK